MRHSQHIAVSVVGVGLRRAGADCGAGQSITLLGRFNQARLTVGISPRPVAIRSYMYQLQKITSWIVSILLGVVAHGLTLGGSRQMYLELIVPGRLRVRR